MHITTLDDTYYTVMCNHCEFLLSVEHYHHIKDHRDRRSASDWVSEEGLEV